MWHIINISNSTNIFFTSHWNFYQILKTSQKDFAVYTVNNNYISGVCLEYILLSSTGEYPDD